MPTVEASDVFLSHVARLSRLKRRTACLKRVIGSARWRSISFPNSSLPHCEQSPKIIQQKEKGHRKSAKVLSSKPWRSRPRRQSRISRPSGDDKSITVVSPNAFRSRKSIILLCSSGIKAPETLLFVLSTVGGLRRPNHRRFR